MGLFIACGIAAVSVDRATRAILPFVALLLVGLLIIILIPQITLILPGLFKLL
ncbi:MAG: TRAP transporter large permease subunit [Gemmatimonadales bacterium]